MCCAASRSTCYSPISNSRDAPDSSWPTCARELVPLIPIAVMTAHTSADYAVTANRCHADEFLVKPIRRRHPDLD